MLSEHEIDELKSLLDRAIANGQFAIGIESPFANEDEDIFGEGDRHDGNVAGSDSWKSFVVICESEDEPSRPELKLLIDQRSADIVANGVIA